MSHCSVPIPFLLRSSFCRAIRDFSASSSLNEGSRIAWNISQGSSLHKPQCSSCFVFTQQSYIGQDSTFIMVVQNGLPCWVLHPLHFVFRCSQVPQNSPHTAAKFVSTIIFSLHIVFARNANMPFLFCYSRYQGRDLVWFLKIV